MTEKDQLVSVVIPTHNRAQFIERALNSVLSQTYSNLEVIIVDDASVDDTESRVAAIMSNDNRVHYVCHIINRGAQAARNTGVQKAKGDYIALLDSDDEWVPEKLEKQMALFQYGSNEINIVYSDFIRKYADGHFEEEQKPRFRGNIYKNALSQYINIQTSTLIIKRASLLQAGLFDERIRAWQEWDLCIRLARHGKFDYLDELLTIYHVEDCETISKNMYLSADGYMDVVNAHTEEIIKYAGVKTLIKHLKRAGNYFMLIPDPKKARICFKKAMQIRPYDCSLWFLYVASQYGKYVYKIAISFDQYYSTIFYRNTCELLPKNWIGG